MRGTLLTHILVLDTLAILAGCILDLLFGDPAGRFHPVCFIGKLISALENKLYRKSDPDRRKQSRGTCLTVLVIIITVLVTAGILVIALIAGKNTGGFIYLILAALLCDSTLAVRDLRKESMQVASALNKGLPDARRALSRIVGRDTENLDEAAVIRAAVETVAENTTDGAVSPLFFLFLGGPAAAMAYKAVNTLDSMVGYKNERYKNLGWASAKLDDVVNILPARVAGVLMCVAAKTVGLDAKGARKVFLRDRLNHASPNSAHTEAACAGALGVQLGGGNVYFGEYVEKPTIGDATRPIEAGDIRRANKLMYATAVLGLGLAASIGCARAMFGGKRR